MSTTETAEVINHIAARLCPGRNQSVAMPDPLPLSPTVAKEIGRMSDDEFAEELAQHLPGAHNVTACNCWHTSGAKVFRVLGDMGGFWPNFITIEDERVRFFISETRCNNDACNC